MDQYRTGRILAKAISVTGWLVAAVCTFFFAYRIAGTHPAMWGNSFPFLVMIVGALSVVLLSWIARAVFDIASAQAGRGA
ncbi:hypothetical protein [Luteimonas sp. R10]|uniref:hypothetical protein n=1 Tax=Luteimonas sp. R10 TaxID=3108176 RepID=UPI003093AB71|nr:hypothetical protein U3649_02265 [Luteimonas sp. R10]